MNLFYLHVQFYLTKPNNFGSNSCDSTYLVQEQDPLDWVSLVYFNILLFLVHNFIVPVFGAWILLNWFSKRAEFQPPLNECLFFVRIKSILRTFTSTASAYIFHHTPLKGTKLRYVSQTWLPFEARPFRQRLDCRATSIIKASRVTDYHLAPVIQMADRNTSMIKNFGIIFLNSS